MRSIGVDIKVVGLITLENVSELLLVRDAMDKRRTP